MSALQITEERISPDVAKKYLAKSLHNRSLRRSRVKLYAKQMSAGEWRFTSETIKFDNQGNCIDGHHRLSAVIDSGETVKMLVSRGENNENYHVIDSGEPRRLADRIEASRLVAAIISGCHIFVNRASLAKPTVDEALHIYAEHRSAIDWIESRYQSTKGIGVAAVWVALMQGYEIDPEHTDEFAMQLLSISPSHSAPAKLRDFLLRLGSLIGTRQNGKYALYRKTIYALKAFLDNRHISQLRESTWTED
jgi:hypothetical protein